MCRLMAYVGTAASLESLLYQPPHSLIVQSYQPQEMTAGLLNADGFGVGWHDAERGPQPFSYRSVLPIWNDINLPHLARYVESSCAVACIRSATPGLAVDLSNCQPFEQEGILAIHNGYIENFRHTLYRPIRETLCDRLYQSIHGTTDSEHLFALMLHHLMAMRTATEDIHRHDPHTIAAALQQAIVFAFNRAAPLDIKVGANMILSTGTHLIASRAANRDPVPTLYWLPHKGSMGAAEHSDEDAQPQAPQPNTQVNGVLIASEPLMPGPWQAIPEQSILVAGADGNVKIQKI